MIEEKTRVPNRPARFELIDKDGRYVGTFLSAEGAGRAAIEFWPDQEQDPDRAGKGWDVQVVGS